MKLGAEQQKKMGKVLARGTGRGVKNKNGILSYLDEMPLISVLLPAKAS
jgi:hypothetical protein